MIATKTLLTSGLPGPRRISRRANLELSWRPASGLNPRKTPRGCCPRDVLSQSAELFRSARGAKIDLALRQRGQLLVGRPFLIEGLLQNACAIVTAELFRPRDQAAVARYLIMLGGLAGVDQGRIEHRLVRDFASDLVGFLDDAIDRRTVDSLHLCAVHLEHLFEALHVNPGFLKMSQKTLLELLVRCFPGHFRQRL